MLTVIDANLIPIAIALLVGLLVGWWMFARSRRRRTGDADDGQNQIFQASEIAPHAAPAELAERGRSVRDGLDLHEGRGLADHSAAATADVAGQVFGVEAHAELPGASGPPDNLQLMKGVGPKLALRLNEFGIIRFDQLASLSHNEVTILDDKLGPFRGRIARDRVVEQAAYLARGDRDGFEAQFGKLGGAV